MKVQQLAASARRYGFKGYLVTEPEGAVFDLRSPEAPLTGDQLETFQRWLKKRIDYQIAGPEGRLLVALDAVNEDSSA